MILAAQNWADFESSYSQRIIWLLKGVHPIIFVSNIFPNSHLIQKCIQNQQLFQKNYWFCIHFWIKWELGKIFNTKMIEWTPFSNPLQQFLTEFLLFNDNRDVRKSSRIKFFKFEGLWVSIKRDLQIYTPKIFY